MLKFFCISILFLLGHFIAEKIDYKPYTGFADIYWFAVFVSIIAYAILQLA